MAGTHVLVVDDEQEVAETYAVRLERNFEMTVAFSGEEALDVLERE